VREEDPDLGRTRECAVDRPGDVLVWTPTSPPGRESVSHARHGIMLHRGHRLTKVLQRHLMISGGGVV